MSGGSLPQLCAVAEADRIGRGISATNMVKVTGNGTKRRINGSKLRRDDPYKKSNTYVTDKGVTSVTPSGDEVNYKWEHIVGVMGLCLLMAAGIVLGYPNRHQSYYDGRADTRLLRVNSVHPYTKT